MTLRLFKITFGWVIGLIGCEFFFSIWKNKEMDWSFILNFSVAGFIGIAVGNWLKNIYRRNKQ